MVWSDLDDIWRMSDVASASPSRCHFSQPFPSYRPQCNDNQISDWKDVDQLAGAKQLQTVYLERNPVAGDVNYRRKLKLALPSLTQIDATLTR